MVARLWEHTDRVRLPDRRIAGVLPVILVKKRRKRSGLLMCAVLVGLPEIKRNVEIQRNAKPWLSYHIGTLFELTELGTAFI